MHVQHIEVAFLIQRRTRAADTGPKFTLATEPLYGTETGLPRRRRTARVGTRGRQPAQAR